MKYSLTISREAESDLAEAFAWYEERRPGLGSEFLEAVEVCLSSIENHPFGHARVHRRIRRALLRRFPFGVFYIVEHDRIEILACFHFRRDPGQLRTRSRD